MSEFFSADTVRLVDLGAVVSIIANEIFDGVSAIKRLHRMSDGTSSAKDHAYYRRLGGGGT